LKNNELVNINNQQIDNNVAGIGIEVPSVVDVSEGIV